MTFFAEHFERINELHELSNINVINYLNLHPNRAATLEKYTEQLQEKIDEATAAGVALTQSAELHSSSLVSVRESIKIAQSSIETLYLQQDGPGIMETLTTLEELHISEQEHINAGIFAKKFTQEYSTLIAPASQKLTVIRANTAAIVSGVTVRLPAGAGVSELTDLNLFTQEASQ